MPSIHATVSCTIPAAPNTVFAVLSDASRMPEWVNGVQSAGWEEGSGADVGGKFDMKYKYGRKTSDLKMEITGVEPESLLEYKTIEGPYPILARFTLRAVGDGTIVTYSQTAYSDSILSALGFLLTGWFAKSMVRRVLRKDLDKLSTSVQSPA